MPTGSVWPSAVTPLCPGLQPHSSEGSWSKLRPWSAIQLEPAMPNPCASRPQLAPVYFPSPPLPARASSSSGPTAVQGQLLASAYTKGVPAQADSAGSVGGGVGVIIIFVFFALP